MRLWQASCIAHGAQGRSLSSLAFETNSSLLAQSARAPCIEDTGLARSHKRDRDSLDVPDSFNDDGPAARIKLLAGGDNSDESINRFLDTGSDVNVIRQAEYTLPSIASGIQ